MPVKTFVVKLDLLHGSVDSWEAAFGRLDAVVEQKLGRTACIQDVSDELYPPQNFASAYAPGFQYSLVRRVIYEKIKRNKR